MWPRTASDLDFKTIEGRRQVIAGCASVIVVLHASGVLNPHVRIRSNDDLKRNALVLAARVLETTQLPAQNSVIFVVHAFAAAAERKMTEDGYFDHIRGM